MSHESGCLKILACNSADPEGCGLLVENYYHCRSVGCAALWQLHLLQTLISLSEKAAVFKSSD